MTVQHFPLKISTGARKIFEITAEVRATIKSAHIQTGLCHLFVRHTSCSIFLGENADPSVQYDLMQYLNRLVPDDDPRYTHNDEGSDDMPAHIKAALLPSSLSLPIENGELLLGTWQGIFLWEHRHHVSKRKLCLSLYS